MQGLRRAFTKAYGDFDDVLIGLGAGVVFEYL